MHIYVYVYVYLLRHAVCVNKAEVGLVIRGDERENVATAFSFNHVFRASKNTYSYVMRGPSQLEEMFSSTAATCGHHRPGDRHIATGGHL